MNQDLLKIRKVAIISLILLLIIELACFFLFERARFFGILISGLLVLFFFVLTLIVYFKASKSTAHNKIKFLLFIFFGKIIVSGVVFFLVYRASFVDMITFLVSFLIFFTVFFNLEVFLIYKKFLFFNT